MQASAVVVSRGVDWITATARGEHQQHDMWDIGEQYLTDCVETIGQEVKRAELRGYKGWATDNCFLGKRDDSVMLRGSSASAEEVYRRLYEQSHEWNITRLDLQVTGKFPHDYEGYGREAEAAAIAAIDRSPASRPRRVASVRGNGRGDTCSIGSRSSQRYLRCYDKTREQRGQVEANLWRWEVEYKQPLSTGIAARLAAQQSRASCIVAVVADEFQRKGVSVPWENGEVIELPTTGVSATSDGRRLVWLNTQVRPVIGKLRETVGLDAVLIALGLDELLQRDGC